MTRKIIVTKVVESTDNGRKLTTVRLQIEGRSMWLNVDKEVLPSAKLSKDTLEVDDAEFNKDKFQVLKCSNENGTFLKLVPKCTFSEASF